MIKVVFRTVIAQITIDGQQYYVVFNFDTTETDNTNCDRVLKTIERLYQGKGMMEVSTLAGGRAYINLTEAKACTIDKVSVVVLQGEC